MYFKIISFRWLVLKHGAFQRFQFSRFALKKMCVLNTVRLTAVHTCYFEVRPPRNSMLSQIPHWFPPISVLIYWVNLIYWVWRLRWQMQRFSLIYFNWWKQWKRINDKVRIKEPPHPQNVIKNKRSPNSFLIGLKSRRVWLVFTEDLLNKWDLSATLQHCPIRVQEQLRDSFVSFFFCKQHTDFGCVAQQKVVWISLPAEDQCEADEGRSKKSARRSRAQTKNSRGPKVIGSERSDLSSHRRGGSLCEIVKAWRWKTKEKKCLRCGFKSARRCLHILLFSSST